MSPYVNVTVVTDQGTVGQPWRDRPIFINSSVDNVPGQERLPLLEGATTPVTAAGQVNTLGPEVLLGGDTLKVTCDDGSTREYISGIGFGKVTATGIATNNSDFLVNHQVIPEAIRVGETSEDQSILALQDVLDRTKIREIDADATLFLTGPGTDVCRIPDAQSKADYEEAATQLDTSIAKARKQILQYKQAEYRLQGLPQYPEVLAELQRLRERIKQVKIEIPRILTLPSLEKIYNFWFNDLESDQDCFPLAEVFQEGNMIADGGNGDTASTLKEWGSKDGPEEAYPKGFKQNGRKPPSFVLYNQKARTPEEYREINRRRYGDRVFTDNVVEAIPQKVSKCRIVRENGKEIGVDVSYRDEAGIEKTTRYNYAFVATGIAREPIEQQLPVAIDKVKDLEGNVVGLGNPERRMWIGGSATGFKAEDFPEKLRNIVEGLGINVNTVSLWVNACLVERLCWTILDQLKADDKKLRSLARTSPTPQAAQAVV